MSDLKPLGSEKLNGDEKLKRILELTYFNSNKKAAQTSKAELVKESKSGGVYAIVKEKDSYYVKKGLTESSVDYIGGMYMKNKNRFSSYSEALKRLELIKGQEELINETKYFLKKKEDASAPAPEAIPPATDAPVKDDMGGASSMGDMEGGMGAPAPDADAAPDANAPEGGEGKENEPEDEYAYMGEVHKFTGKLQEELRKQEKRLTSKDIKWVLNMVISSLDLDKLEDKDLEEIADKFDRDEIHNAGGDEEETGVGGDEPSAEETPAPNEDLGEDFDPVGQLEEFINEPSPFDEVDLSSYAEEEPMGDEMPDEPNHEGNLNEKKKPAPVRPPLGAHGETHLEEVEIDMDEIKNEIHNSISQTLSKYFK